MIRKLKKCLFTNALLCIIIYAQAQTSFKFDFGSGKTEKGYIKVLPATMYSETAGYGFYNSIVTAADRGGKDNLRGDFITSDKPFFFSVKLPEGNYDVKVIMGDKEGTSLTTIKAECRRLMVKELQTKKGEFKTVSFTVHIRDSVIKTTGEAVRLKSREHSYFHWDDKLTLEFNNSNPKVCAIEITPNKTATTIFLAGNSTVVDQADEPYAAWGQMFPCFFQPYKIAIANYAESGETLKAFKNERRLAKVWSMIKAGDYLFIEFTHNDQKPGPDHLDAFTTYKETLKEWISEARKRNVIPVLVTSMHRRNFDSSGHIINTLRDYPEAMRQTAKEENVALIDLNAMSKIFYEALGPQQSTKAFVHYAANTFPGQEKKLEDNTHFNNYGAYQLAKCIVQAIKTNKMELSKYLIPDLPFFDPAHPDDTEQWNLPVSPLRSAAKPDGN
jgi:lysophospholipase L1-like esterase